MATRALTEPSAAQTELAARLTVRPDLTELVLTTPAAGRGRPDDAGSTEGDQLRVAVSVLARWCAAHPRQDHVVTEPPPDDVRRTWWSRRIDRVTVRGESLETMVLRDWRRRVQTGSGLRWRRVWQQMVARDRLPASVDVLARARSWIEQAGADRVSVDLQAHPDVPDPIRLDLVRRLNQVLATRGAGARAATATLPWPRPHLFDLGVPRPILAWAVEQGERQAAGLASLPCRVHGDPRIVVPSTDPARARHVPATASLALAVEVLEQLPGGLVEEGNG